MNSKTKKILLEYLPTLTPELQVAIKDLLSEVDELENKLCFGGNDLTDEVWRDVVGYEGLYEVSNLGRIKSFYLGAEKILKPHIGRGGYIKTHLTKKYAYRHRVENLELATYSENSTHAFRTGLTKTLQEIDCPAAKLTKEDIEYICNNYKSCDKENGIRALAKKFAVNPGTIEDIVKFKRYKNVE